MTMPELTPLPTPQAVVDEHLDALNRGDWNRLMAQYPDDVRRAVSPSSDAGRWVKRLRGS